MAGGLRPPGQTFYDRKSMIVVLVTIAEILLGRELHEIHSSANPQRRYVAVNPTKIWVTFFLSF
jgi:hypothetical protein